MHRSYLALITTLGGTLCACGSSSATAPATASSAGAEQAAPAADATAVAAAPAPRIVDPLVASPDVYKLVKEGPRMRVIQATWQPGQRDNQHGHPALAAYALTELFGIGNEAEDSQISIRIRKGQALLQAPVQSHALENRGKNAAQLLIFEIKDGQPSEPLPKTAKEPEVVSPTIYELVAFDTHIHVLRATWKPGEADELHGHPVSTLYALTDVDGKMTDDDGKSTPFSMKAGTVRFEEPVKAHSFENTGAADAQMLIVEQRD